MIWPILLVGLSLRLISLNQSLWLDEAISLTFSQKFSLWGMITQYSIADFHPPGYFAVIWVWTRVFGISEISARLPSVIFGVLTIFLVYLIGKKLVSKEVGLISAVLLAINPLHIYYSQEARMYSLAAFAVSLNMLLFLKLVKSERGKMGNMGEKVIFVLSNVLVLLSDYVAYLIFPAQLIFLLLFKRNVLKNWFIFLMTAILAGIWWVPVFLKQLGIGSVASANLPAWKEVVGAIGFKPLALTYVKFIIGRIGFTNQLIYALIFLPIGLVFLFLILRSLSSLSSLSRKIALSWLLVPIILAALISIFIPVFSYFRLLFVLPAFLILIAFGINSWGTKLKPIFLGLVILSQIIFTITYLGNPQFQREDWRSLVSFLKSQTGSIVLFESSGSFTPFDYYAGSNFKGIGALKNFPAKDDGDIIDLKATVEGTPDIYLINYLVEITDPNRLVAKKLTDLGYSQEEIKDFPGVGFIYHYVYNDKIKK